MSKAVYSYVLRGNCKGVITYWSYWSRIDAKTEEPIDTEVLDGNAVDLDDPSARYSRIHRVPEAAHVEVGTDAEESLLPVLRGVTMVPCDPGRCCGQCFSIPKSVLTDVRSAVYGDCPWIECENCGKWRRQRIGSTLSDAQSFVCSDDWDPTRRSCDAPEEPLDPIEVDKPPCHPAKPAPEFR